MRIGFVLAITTAFVSGCLETGTGPSVDGNQTRRLGGAGWDANSTALSSQDQAYLSSGETVLVDVVGVGWGRLDLLALNNVSLKTEVSHDAFDVSRPHDGNASKYYDPPNYTFIFLYGADERPHYGAGYSLQWWGLPFRGPLANGASFAQPVPATSAAVLLMYSSVPGFHIRLQTGPEEIVKRYAWQLADNPTAHYIIPKPTGQAVAETDVARAQRDRDWTTGAISFEPGLLRAVGWRLHPATGVRAGVIQDTIGIEPSRTESFPPRIPGLLLPNTGSGGGFGYADLDLDRVSKLEMYRHVRESGAGPDNEVVGAAFLALPYWMGSAPTP